MISENFIAQTAKESKMETFVVMITGYDRPQTRPISRKAADRYARWCIRNGMFARVVQAPVDRVEAA